MVIMRSLPGAGAAARLDLAPELVAVPAHGRVGRGGAAAVDGAHLRRAQGAAQALPLPRGGGVQPAAPRLVTPGTLRQKHGYNQLEEERTRETRE